MEEEDEIEIIEIEAGKSNLLPANTFRKASLSRCAGEAQYVRAFGYTSSILTALGFLSSVRHSCGVLVCFFRHFSRRHTLPLLGDPCPLPPYVVVW